MSEAIARAHRIALVFSSSVIPTSSLLLLRWRAGNQCQIASSDSNWIQFELAGQTDHHAPQINRRWKCIVAVGLNVLQMSHRNSGTLAHLHQAKPLAFANLAEQLPIEFGVLGDLLRTSADRDRRHSDLGRGFAI